MSFKQKIREFLKKKEKRLLDILSFLPHESSENPFDQLWPFEDSQISTFYWLYFCTFTKIWLWSRTFIITECFFLFHCWHLHIWQKEPLELDQHDCSYMKTSTRGMKTKKYHEHVSEIYLFILIQFVYMKYFVHVK